MFFRKKSPTKYRGDKMAKTSYLPQITATQKNLLCITTLFLSVYITMAIYTPWTGSFGGKVSGLLLEYIGGSLIILLLFISYVSISKLISKDIPHFYRQSVATILVFLIASLLLGLYIITARTTFPLVTWLSPGKLGIYLAELAFSMLGAAGTLLLGLISLYISLLLYGVTIYTNMKLPNLSKLSCYFNKNFKKCKGNNIEDTVSNNVKYPNKRPVGAPNIAEFNGNSEDYFNVLEDDKDISANGDDYEHTNSVNEQLILDPSFNLNNSKNKKVKQGIFPPPIDIFGSEELHEGEMNEEKAAPFGKKIIQTLGQFGIEAFLAEILVGPTVIQIRIQLAPGIKVNKVAALAKDIALAIAVPSLRIEAPIPGKPYIGIEIPNPKRRGIPIRTVLGDSAYQNSKYALPLPFGVAVNGDSVVVGLEELPHLLVSGTTGSGKSVFINSCIVGLCSMRSPEELRMILVDPKRVEMAVYDKLPHLLTPPVTDTKKAVHILAWAIREMERRYSSFAKARVRNLEGFNEKVLLGDRLPLIVIVVDELADLMMTAPKEVEEYICRLAQMARATGIHLILATQRPSVNVVTGLIKANIPARVAFTLPSNADSRTIIDCAGAEKLLGKGDMLFLSTKHPKPIRIQAPWIEEIVLSNWLLYLQNMFGGPDFIEINTRSGQTGDMNAGTYDDDLLEDAIETVMSTGIASASGLQRRLRVGFSRASRLIDMMEQLGIVGPADGPRPREILIEGEKALELLDVVLNREGI